jgi:RNA polymerase sigma-70 factor (ECF subfamily)
MSVGNNDDALVLQAVAGDEDALESLLLSHFNRLAADVSQRLPDDVRNVLSAEDVVQDAFIVVFQRISGFEPRGGSTFFAWLSKIAENCLMDAVKALRAAKRGGGRFAVEAQHPEMSDMFPLLELLAAHSHTPSRSTAAHEAASAMKMALDALDADYRDVLYFRYIEMQPIAGIAERLKRSEGAVHMLLSRALEALRSRMGDTGRYFTRKA